MQDRFLADILTNRHNRAILERWNELALPDAWLVAGCLFQTVWNLQSGRPPEGPQTCRFASGPPRGMRKLRSGRAFPHESDIKDYDIFYFHGDDLTEDGERAVQARVDALLGDLGVCVEASNQARVHLWYELYFGQRYEPLLCSRDGIARFLVPATCVGVKPGEVHAPYGLSLLYEGVLGMNPLVPHRDLFEQKTSSYRSRWPWLRVQTDTVDFDQP